MLVTAIQHLMSINEYFSFFPMMTPCSIHMTTEIFQTKFSGLVSFVNANNLVHLNLYFMYFLSCIEIREDYTRIHKDEIKHHSNKNSGLRPSADPFLLK